MKKLLVLLCVFAMASAINAQSNINELLAAGVDDAERFSNDYLAPVSEGALYSISNGWYNSAKSKPLGGFEIGIVGNLSYYKDKKKSFVLNTADYDNIQFVDGSTSKSVATSLGDLEGIMVFVEAEIAPGVTSREEFELPTGLASEGINFIPSGFVQASVGIIKGTELKARFLPKIDTDDVDVGFFGVGIQHDFTEWLPADKLLPIAISGVIGYTSLNGTYDFTNTSLIQGSDQRLETKMKTWVFQAVVSTKLPIINFYGGLGYLTGKSDTDVLGTYEVQSGPFAQTVEDPFSLRKKASGVTATVGTKLKLAFFRLNIDYSLAEYNNLSFGINFGFR